MNDRMTPQAWRIWDDGRRPGYDEASDQDDLIPNSGARPTMGFVGSNTLFNYQHPSGLIVGRFNIVHITHFDIITYLESVAGHSVIGLGSAQYDLDHPKPGELLVKQCLRLEERMDLMLSCFRGHDTTIAPVYDCPSDEEWARHALETAGAVSYVLTEKRDEQEAFRAVAGHRIKIITWPYYSGIRNGIVLDNIINDRPYKHLLPEPCAEFLDKIGIVDRLKKLHAIDREQFGHLYLPQAEQTDSSPRPAFSPDHPKPLDQQGAQDQAQNQQTVTEIRSAQPKPVIGQSDEKQPDQTETAQSGASSSNMEDVTRTKNAEEQP